jgi:hypothetical protein
MLPRPFDPAAVALALTPDLVLAGGALLIPFSRRGGRRATRTSAPSGWRAPRSSP